MAKQANNNGANLGFEAQLWTAADKLRGNMEPSDYKHVALGLIFLKYISDAFEAKRADLLTEDLADAEDPEEYLAENVFWVPREARWSHLRARAKQPMIGKDGDDGVERDAQTVMPEDFYEVASTLQGVIRGKPIRTTVSNKAAPCPLDKVNRQFHAPAPNRLWVSDFTYVATWAGFVHVAFVIDAYARRIVGWRVSRTADAGFVFDALEQALHARRTAQGGPLHRSASAEVVTSFNRSDCYRLERQLPGGVRTRKETTPFHGAPNKAG